MATFLVDLVTVLRPTRHTMDHFGDILPSQSLGLLLKKLNPTQNTENAKPKQTRNINLNQHTNLRTVHMCAMCTSQCTTVVHIRAQNSSNYFEYFPS